MLARIAKSHALGGGRALVQRMLMPSLQAEAHASFSGVGFHTSSRLLSGASPDVSQAEFFKEQKREITNPKIIKLAEEITSLNLLEVADLTELLKEKLGVPAGGFGMPMGMSMGGAPAAGGAVPAAQAAAPVAEEKTSFDIKLDSYDAASKIKVIKEIRGVTELGLKEAKELVEGAPCVVKKGLKKEEAEAIKKKLEEAGAKITLA